jgi:hypothetical protein
VASLSQSFPPSQPPPKERYETRRMSVDTSRNVPRKGVDFDVSDKGVELIDRVIPSKQTTRKVAANVFPRLGIESFGIPTGFSR